MQRIEGQVKDSSGERLLVPLRAQSSDLYIIRTHPLSEHRITIFHQISSC